MRGDEYKIGVEGLTQEVRDKQKRYWASRIGKGWTGMEGVGEGGVKVQ